MAPQYANDGLFSVNSNVSGFGILLLDMERKIKDFIVQTRV